MPEKSKAPEPAGGGRSQGYKQPSLRVFARKLRGDVRVRARGLLLGLFVHLEAGFARPAALEIVLDAELQPAEPFGFQLDRIAVHEWIETPVIGAGGDDVAGVQRMDARQPGDARADLVAHIVGVEVLHQYAVVP